MKKDMFKKIGMLAVSATLACGAGSSEAMKQPDATTTGAGSADAKTAAVPVKKELMNPAMCEHLIDVNSACIGIAQHIVKSQEGLDISELSALIRSVFNAAFVQGIESVFAPGKSADKWKSPVTMSDIFKLYGITLSKGGVGSNDLKTLIEKIITEKATSLKEAVGKKLNSYKFTESVANVEKLLQFIDGVVKPVDQASFDDMVKVKTEFECNMGVLLGFVKDLEKALNLQKDQDMTAVTLEKIGENEKLNKTIDELQKALKINADADVVKEVSKKIAANEKLSKTVDDLQKVLNVQQGQDIMVVASEKVAANEKFIKTVNELKKALKIQGNSDVVKEVLKKITDNEKNNEILDKLCEMISMDSDGDILNEIATIVDAARKLATQCQDTDRLLQDSNEKLESLQSEHDRVLDELNRLKKDRGNSSVAKSVSNSGVAKLLENTVKKSAAPAAPAKSEATEASAPASFASLFGAL